jgi:Fe-S cluster assembly ATPase SufC
MDMLEVKDLSVKVDGKLILKDLNFNLKEGISHIPFWTKWLG